jgi:hypothetical protein
MNQWVRSISVTVRTERGFRGLAIFASWYTYSWITKLSSPSAPTPKSLCSSFS